MMVRLSLAVRFALPHAQCDRVRPLCRVSAQTSNDDGGSACAHLQLYKENPTFVAPRPYAESKVPKPAAAAANASDDPDVRPPTMTVNHSVKVKLGWNVWAVSLLCRDATDFCASVPPNGFVADRFCWPCCCR